MIIAQDPDVIVGKGANAAEFPLPTEVKDAINAVTPPPGEVFNVGANEVFEGQVLRYEKIQFASGASLTLSHEHEFLAIVADELLFAAPLQTATIKTTRPVLHGKDGDPGKPGNKGGRTGRGDHHGERGGRGGGGQDGGDGGEQVLPTIYILANAVQAQNPPSGFPFLRIELEGVEGGDGGDGGAGGEGGRGGDGKRGKDGTLSCKRGGGNAGPGGYGGPGGHAGDGGKSGDGGDLVIIGRAPVIDRLKFSDVDNDPGAPGQGGQSGPSGPGGKPGARGGGTGFCRGGKNAERGTSPPRTEPKEGQSGPEGRRGTTTLDEVADYNDVLA